MPLAARRICLTLAVLPALMTCLPAQAGAHWLCSLSEDVVRLVCVADTDPRLVDAAAPAGPAAPAVRVRGTTFPLDPRLAYTVDLWSPPSDPDWLAQLARSTLCFRSPGCTVWVAPWGRQPVPTAELRAGR